MVARIEQLLAKRIAFMGGAYGNLPALAACVRDAGRRRCDLFVFLGDAIGFCGHSDEVLAVIRHHFDVLLAGNLEIQAVAGSSECGCNYASAEDEHVGCLAYQYAMQSLGNSSREWLKSWPQSSLAIDTSQGVILLCHGSPDETSEFLYESELDDARLNQWLDDCQATGLVCTHSGLPWVRRLENNRWAMNCGVIGKPDNDGDPAVHYGLIEMGSNRIAVTIERIEYDHLPWADQLMNEGVDDIFTEPLRTGSWTCGVASLPMRERNSAPHWGQLTQLSP